MGRRLSGGLIAAVAVVVAACSGGPVVRPGRAVSSSPAGSHVLGRYQPLWPFGGEREAANWQRRYRVSGLQPWRLSADQTALAFDRYLGFDRVDRVVGRTVGVGEARIAMGTGSGTAAAIIHLVRLGTGPDAPWEVVGTDDRGLTVTVPAYGAAVASPVTVSGRVAGAVERVRVQVRQRSAAAPIGASCCVAAGADHARWSATVSFRGAIDPVLTVVASTGGGRTGQPQRFAVTAVRAGG